MGAPTDGGEAATGVTKQAVVGGDPSTAADDFIVFLSHSSEPTFSCGATLVAPNLVVTAKHCLYQYESLDSICGPSGDPEPSAEGGGFVKEQFPLNEIGFFIGFDGKKRYSDGAEPDARAAKIIDDGTKMLCSHDFAYVVLDKPLTTVPVAKLRLGRRPERGDLVAVAGWGQVEDRATTKFRQRRTDIDVRQVGLAQPPGAGTVAVRTFETGPGACTGDSGSPAFDLEKGTALGVTARALGMVLTDPVSPCLPNTVSVVFTLIADFPKELQAALAEAKAEPWLEGRATAGLRPDDEACTADIECRGGRCAGVTETREGACKPDCTKPGFACPAGQVCGSTRVCEPAPPASSTSASGAPPPPDPAALDAEAQSQSEGASSCATSPSSPSTSTGALLALASLVFVIRRRDRRVGERENA